MNSFLPGRADPGKRGWPNGLAGKELIVTARQLPVRTLSRRPDLDQLKRQARELLQALRAGDAGALAEVNAHYRGADPAAFALHDAQLVLARAYGFDSWPKLKAYVDGATVRRLIEAVRANDAEKARAMLQARPELANHGGVAGATTAGLYRQTELARKMLAGEAGFSLAEDTSAGQTAAEQLLWGAACGGAPDIVRMALEHIDWPRDDSRWYSILEQPLRLWSHGFNPPRDRGVYLVCFRQVLERCDPNVRGRLGRTMLHEVAGMRDHATAAEQVAFATALLDAGARTDVRDELLQSTPLGWACRRGRIGLVKLFLQRGADPVEADAAPAFTPRAWATKMGHAAVAAALDGARL